MIDPKSRFKTVYLITVISFAMGGWVWPAQAELAAQVEQTEPAREEPVTPPPSPDLGTQQQANSIVDFVNDVWDGSYNPLNLAFVQYVKTLPRHADFADQNECLAWYENQLALTQAMSPGEWLLYKMGAIAASSPDLDVQGGIRTWGPAVMCNLATTQAQPQYLWDDQFCQIYVQPTTQALIQLNQLDAQQYGNTFQTYQRWIVDVDNYDGCDVAPAPEPAAPSSRVPVQ